MENSEILDGDYFKDTTFIPDNFTFDQQLSNQKGTDKDVTEKVFLKNLSNISAIYSSISP